jgi:dCMP deaminase
MTDWDERFMMLADHVSSWSKDLSTQVGAVIVGSRKRVVSLGYSGFPRGVRDYVDKRHERPAKYLWTEHAERNAIYNAAESLVGCTLYVPWYPCMDCARAIVQSGIVELVAIEPDWDDTIWGVHFDAARELFDEVGVRVRWYG